MTADEAIKLMDRYFEQIVLSGGSYKIPPRAGLVWMSVKDEVKRLREENANLHTDIESWNIQSSKGFAEGYYEEGQ